MPAICRKCSLMMDYREPPNWATPHRWKCVPCRRIVTAWNHELKRLGVEL